MCQQSAHSRSISSRLFALHLLNFQCQRRVKIINTVRCDRVRMQKESFLFFFSSFFSSSYATDCDFLLFGAACCCQVKVNISPENSSVFVAIATTVAAFPLSSSLVSFGSWLKLLWIIMFWLSRIWTGTDLLHAAAKQNKNRAHMHSSEGLTPLKWTKSPRKIWE